MSLQEQRRNSGSTTLEMMNGTGVVFRVKQAELGDINAVMEWVQRCCGLVKWCKDVKFEEVTGFVEGMLNEENGEGGLKESLWGEGMRGGVDVLECVV